jgi:hypothetical protein
MPGLVIGRSERVVLAERPFNLQVGQVSTSYLNNSPADRLDDVGKNIPVLFQAILEGSTLKVTCGPPG